MSDELKPCPHETHPIDGQHRLRVVKRVEYAAGEAPWSVLCLCGAAGPLHGNKAKAIAAWNRRADPDGWVRVEDGLPVAGKELEVAALIPSGGYGRFAYVDLVEVGPDGEIYWGDMGRNDSFDYDVYAWRYASPLPPPPKEPSE